MFILYYKLTEKSVIDLILAYSGNRVLHQLLSVSCTLRMLPYRTPIADQHLNVRSGSTEHSTFEQCTLLQSRKDMFI